MIRLEHPEEGKFNIQYKNLKTDELVAVRIPEVWKQDEYVYRLDAGDKVFAIGTNNQFILIGQSPHEATIIFYEEKEGVGSPLNCFSTKLTAGEPDVSE